MRILDIREQTVSIASDIRKAETPEARPKEFFMAEGRGWGQYSNSSCRCVEESSREVPNLLQDQRIGKFRSPASNAAGRSVVFHHHRLGGLRCGGVPH